MVILLLNCGLLYAFSDMVSQKNKKSPEKFLKNTQKIEGFLKIIFVRFYCRFF